LWLKTEVNSYSDIYRINTRDRCNFH